MKTYWIGLFSILLLIVVGCSLQDNIKEGLEIANQDIVKDTTIKKPISNKILPSEITEKVTSCGNNICEIIFNESINSCRQDCKKLGTMLKEREKRDFYPQYMTPFILTTYGEDYFEHMSKYSEQAWINYSFDYLENTDKKILYQYIEENQSYWEWTAPPYEGGESRLVEYIYTIKEKINGKYIFNESSFGFTIYVTSYKTKEMYDKITNKQILNTKEFYGESKISDYVDKRIETRIIKNPDAALVFLPEVNTVIEIDYKIIYAYKDGLRTITDWVEFDFTQEQRDVILEGYLIWLTDSSTEFEMEIEVEKEQEIIPIGLFNA